jgi:hypothetical protein
MIFGADQQPEVGVLPLAGATAPQGETPTLTAQAALGAEATTALQPTPPATSTSLAAVPPATEAPTQAAAQVSADAPTQAPTGTPAVAPSPTAQASQAGDALKKLAAAESALHSGSLTASVGGSQGSQGSNSTAEVRFDLGGNGRSPRYYLKTEYKGDQASQVVEYIMIGEQSWQRSDGGKWVEGPPQEAPWGQVQSFLPGAAAVANASLDSAGEHSTLRWYDAGQDSDVSVQLDPATGVPLTMERVSRKTQSLLKITYTSWNQQVTIKPPETSR